ncbi:MAG: hypothetical protein Q6359_02125 [Candidatus Brocadiales bacterium]|nr:hypothetical protein [Candidatus Brocadiales bacterium]
MTRLAHVRAIIEGQGRENVGECDYDRTLAHDALISTLNDFVNSLPEQEHKRFFSPWLRNRHTIGLLGLELAFQIVKRY